MADVSEDDFYDDDENDCANCGGTGYVASCFSEYACVDPEEGCDECMRRCDWCYVPTPKEKKARDEMREVLRAVLAPPPRSADGGENG